MMIRTTMEPEPDHELLRRFAEQGDEHAFGGIVRRHLGLVLGTAVRITALPPLAEEVAQDVFTLLAARARILARGNAPLAVWLHRTARFKALRAAEKERRRRRGLEKLTLMDRPENGPGIPAGQRPDWQPLLAHLDAALDALPQADREVLLLHFHENLTHVQIAARLGKKPEAVRQRSSRAVERLRTLLRARHGAAFTAAGLSVALPLVLGGSGSAAMAATVARSALGAAPSVAVPVSVSMSGWSVVFTRLLQTMNSTQTAAVAVTALCLSALTWQEFSIAEARAGVASLQSRSAPRSAGGEGDTPALRPTAEPGGWEHGLDELGAGRLTPAALREFARRVKRAQENDPSVLPGLARFTALLRGDLLRQAAEMGAGPDPELEPADRAALCQLLLASLSDQPDTALTLAARAWSGLPEEGRAPFARAAALLLKDWSARQPADALAWFRDSLTSGESPLGTAAGDLGAPLAGALTAGLLTLPTDAAPSVRELMALLPPEGRSPALTAAVGHTKSGSLLESIARLAAAELPAGEQAPPLAAAAARLAQSVSLSEATALFGTIPFPDAESRASAAVATAVSSAINRNASTPVRREAAWEWLSGQAAAPAGAGAASGESLAMMRAGFLGALAGGDPVWALDRFESMGGAAAGQEALTVFLRHIPETAPAVADRYASLAARLTDPAARRDALERMARASGSGGGEAGPEANRTAP